MLREPTLEKLHAMRLRVLADTWLEQDKSSDTLAMTFDERLALLVDAEMLARENARLTKNLRDAKLRIAEACIEGIDFPRERQVDKAVVRQLATCSPRTRASIPRAISGVHARTGAAALLGIGLAQGAPHGRP